MRTKWTMIKGMEAATSMTSDLQASIRSELESYITANVFQWSGLCQDLFNQERRHMIEKEPKKEDLDVHRTVCRLLILIGTALENSILDMPVQERVKMELKGRLGQLETSWSQFQNPMSEEEADRILKKVFPE